MTWNDFQSLQDLSAEISRQKVKLQRLRDAAGVKSPRLDGIPRGSGPVDRIGEIAASIADAENDLIRLERDYESICLKFGSWINRQDDYKASFILTARYIERMSWDQIAREVSNCEGETTSPDGIRKYCTRYLKQHLEKETENNDQEGR